ncbi:hypothetical protein [Roseateles sp. BYS87W]|uniref:Uncharacterized protein n=1 Tax=Pelomonas baiyunensis TaxID=3299026 RepID=A0ABW7GV37_9BURK
MTTTAITTYYVQGKISADGNYADCSYFLDQAAKQPVEGSTLSISYGETACAIAQADGSELVLLGASFKTLGRPPVMTDSNFSATDGTGSLQVPMPPSTVVTKGIVLLFSKAGSVDGLYASSDPELTNGSGL